MRNLILAITLIATVSAVKANEAPLRNAQIADIIWSLTDAPHYAMVFTGDNFKTREFYNEAHSRNSAASEFPEITKLLGKLSRGCALKKKGRAYVLTEQAVEMLKAHERHDFRERVLCVGRGAK